VDRRRPRIVVAALLVGAVLVATSASPAAGMGRPADTGTPDQDLAVRSYLSAFPNLTYQQARQRVRQQAARELLIGRWVEQYEASFGGTWYDPATGTWHVAATNRDVLTVLVAEARNNGIPVASHLVQHSYRELAAIAETVNAGRHPTLGRAAIERARVDVERNRVSVNLGPQDVTPNARAALGEPVVVEPVADSPHPTPAACTDRFSCAAPLTGGVAIWQGSLGNYVCSLGYTGRKSDGSRWAITAGHCTDTLNEVWGHYGTPIGPVRFRNNPYDTGSGTDTALIRMDDPVWKDAAGGYQYHNTVSGHRVDLDSVITSVAQIEVGNVVCFNGTHTDGFSSNCGTVDIVIDTCDGCFGLTRVSGYASCGGDSGGSVLSYPSGQRRGVGIISGSNRSATLPCGPGAGRFTWFDQISSAAALWGGVTIETR
jgi:streptogrisin C